MATVAVMPEPVAPIGRRRTRSRFFVTLGLLMLILAIAGFWPQYFSAAVGGTPEPRTQFWVIHLHAAIFVTWLLAYIWQAAMVATGRTAIHVKLGPWLAAFGLSAALFGLFVAANLAVRQAERTGDFERSASFVFFPFIDMIYLASFLAVALWFRKRPEIHKRAMFLATFSIAVVGLGRVVRRTGIENPWIWEPLNLAPLLIALAYDAIVCRRLYAVMLVGLALHAFRINAHPLIATEWWLPVGRALIAPFR